MITFILILIRSNSPTERITVDLSIIPSVHEYVSVGGNIYRVEDVTHNIETREIEVRAVG